MKLTAWGRYPVVATESLTYYDEATLRKALCSSYGLIPFGNGRSYGDCALAGRTVHMCRLDRFIHFDDEAGLLTCEAGVMLAEIVETFVPRGWFLQVTPGTKLITVGGAIAADIHGKNHHLAGCFSETLHSFRLMLADGSVVTCSRKQNRELYLATCGGMGLTGIILEASFFLTRIPSSWINQRTIKNGSLEETFAAFEEHAHASFSVAWIDCLQKGSALGRSLLMIGNFADDGDLDYRRKAKLTIPVDFPGFVLNPLSIKGFNALYYAKAARGKSMQRVSLDSFFYPLDTINDWNRIYGRRGFTQYQVIFPKAASFAGMKHMLSLTAESSQGSFLAVLKLSGVENDNYLSFPLEGYSLALDFKITGKVFELLNRLDALTSAYGGRVYLAKDARISRRAFEQGYPRLSAFKKVREQYDPCGRFASMQSMRLGL